MKTLIIMLISVTLSLGVSAQRKGYYRTYRGYYHTYRPRVYVSPFSYGLSFGYPYYGYYIYPYYSYPYNPYFGRVMPYKLALQIESIKDDYRNRIREARKDKTLSHSQRRQEIRNLKTERDEDIINAKREYSRSPRGNNRYPES